MKIENKIILPFIVFFICFLLIGAIFLNFISITKSNYQNIKDYDSRFIIPENLNIYYDLIREASFLDYQKSGKQEYLNRYEKYSQKSTSIYELLVNEMINSNLREEYLKKFSIFKKILSAEKKVINKTLPENYLLSGDYLSLKEEFDEARDLPKEFHILRVKRDMEKNISKAGLYLIILIITLLLSLVLVASEFLIVRKDVIIPMKKISHGLDEMRKSKFGMSIRTDKKSGMHWLVDKLNKTSSDMEKIVSEREKKILVNEACKEDLSKKIHGMKKESKEFQRMIKLAAIHMEDQKRKEKKMKSLQSKVIEMRNMLKLATLYFKEHEKQAKADKKQ